MGWAIVAGKCWLRCYRRTISTGDIINNHSQGSLGMLITITTTRELFPPYLWHHRKPDKLIVSQLPVIQLVKCFQDPVDLVLVMTSNLLCFIAFAELLADSTSCEASLGMWEKERSCEWEIWHVGSNIHSFKLGLVYLQISYYWKEL